MFNTVGTSECLLLAYEKVDCGCGFVDCGCGVRLHTPTARANVRSAPDVILLRPEILLPGHPDTDNSTLYLPTPVWPRRRPSLRQPLLLNTTRPYVRRLRYPPRHHAARLFPSSSGGRAAGTPSRSLYHTTPTP